MARLQPYIGRVTISYLDRKVLWSLSSSEARELADAFDEEAAPGDLAHRDADALRAAADELDPATPCICVHCSDVCMNDVARIGICGECEQAQLRANGECHPVTR